MATKGTALEVVKTKARAMEPPLRIAEVSPKNYRGYSDEALDSEIVESFNAAHGHYTALRREVVLRLLPALMEMRGRHALPGARNDLNAKLGLPKRAGWEDVPAFPWTTARHSAELVQEVHGSENTKFLGQRHGSPQPDTDHEARQEPATVI